MMLCTILSRGKGCHEGFMSVIEVSVCVIYTVYNYNINNIVDLYAYTEGEKLTLKKKSENLNEHTMYLGVWREH